MSRRWKAVALAGALLGGGCDQAGTEVRPPASHGTLAVEIIDTADVTLQPTVDGALDVTLVFQSDYGLFDPSSPLVGRVRLDAYPEVDRVAYTARLSAPAYPQGACGAAPLSLALSLTRRAANAHVGGGLAVYCGDGVFAGEPQRILRLAGDLPR
jgi:hypothetical protein